MTPLGLHHTLSQSFSEALYMLKTNTTALTMAYKTLHTVPLKPDPIYLLLSLDLLHSRHTKRKSWHAPTQEPLRPLRLNHASLKRSLGCTLPPPGSCIGNITSRCFRRFPLISCSPHSFPIPPLAPHPTHSTFSVVLYARVSSLVWFWKLLTSRMQFY